MNEAPATSSTGQRLPVAEATPTPSRFGSESHPLSTTCVRSSGNVVKAVVSGR